jgi:hypothetical protein
MALVVHKDCNRARCGDIAQVVSEHLDGQSVLFRDCDVKLQEQIQIAEILSKHFNPLARETGVAEIDLADLRNDLRPEADRRISDWLNLGRVQTLQLFGTTEEMRAGLERCFLLTQASTAVLLRRVRDMDCALFMFFGIVPAVHIRSQTIRLMRSP